MGTAPVLTSAVTSACVKVAALEFPGMNWVIADYNANKSEEVQVSNDDVTDPRWPPDARVAQGSVMYPRLLPSLPQYCPQEYYLTPRPRGSLNSMVAVPLPSLQPPPGQVLIRVQAVGLNFRDVLNVLGMYPGDPGEPGADVAGIIEAVGARRHALAPGWRSSIWTGHWMLGHCCNL
eukprot:jgi/Botrbrau1/19844/Bobra.0124s0080.1